MSRTIARILMSVLLLPMGLVVYLTTVSMVEQVHVWNYDDRQLFGAAGAASWLAVAGCWWMLWRKSVDWTTRRVVGTAVAAAVALLLGIVAYLLWGRQAPELGAMIGSIAAPTAWLIA